MISISDLEEKSANFKGRKNPYTKIGIDGLINPQPIKKTEDINIKPPREKQKKKKTELTKKISQTNVSKKNNDINTENALVRPKQNYIPIPNELIENIYTKKIGINEIKFLLLIVRETVGWGKKYCNLSKKDVEEKTTIPISRFYDARKNLADEEIIQFGKDPDSLKNYYFIKQLNKKIEKNKSELEEFIIMKNKDKKMRMKELKEAAKLVDHGEKPENEIIKLANFLYKEGTLKGEPCHFPMSYLASGTYDSVLNMSKMGKFNSDLIWKILSTHNLDIPLPQDIQDKLSKTDLEWIEKRGGLRHIGSMNENTVKKSLGMFI